MIACDVETPTGPCCLPPDHDGDHWRCPMHNKPQPSEQEFLSHYAADVTVPQPSEPEPCDHGSYWTDHDGRDHCLVCPHVSQPSGWESDRL